MVAATWVRAGLAGLASLVIVGLGALGAARFIDAGRERAELRGWLARQFHPRPDCPIADPFVEPSVDYDCFEGRLGAYPITVIVGAEPGGRAVSWSYLGIYLTALDDGWLAPWRTRVWARGDLWGRRAGGPERVHLLVGPPASEPIRAVQTPNGAFVAWRFGAALTVSTIESRLAELEATLPRIP